MSFGFRSVRAAALWLAIPMGGLCAAALLVADAHWLMAAGPSTTGHEGLACESCHRAAPGTTRQQIQAKLARLTGDRAVPVDFGYRAVSSAECVHCHSRPNERHPIHRFNEPKFNEAVAQIDARSCLSCHAEHDSSRVSVGATFCASCHEGLKMKNDPLDVSHRRIVRRQDWTSCLGCHDFHGNHHYETPDRMADAASPEEIEDYLDTGARIYASEKIHRAKEERDD